MTFVFSDIAFSILFSSIFIVSGLISTNTILAPLNTKALAVDTKVKEGIITSSPSLISQINAAISNPAVQDGVKKIFWESNSFSINLHACLENSPFPEIFPVSIDFFMYSISFPKKHGLLKGIICIYLLLIFLIFQHFVWLLSFCFF